MSLEIITMWYNEEFLAPYFLRHYAWADRITLLYDVDSTDHCLLIAKSCPNVSVQPFRFPDMMDEELKRDRINAAYKQVRCDYALAVDADEFVFCKEGDVFHYDLRPFLAANAAYDLFCVSLYQIYRHEDDAPLNPDLPAVPQRRHGDPNMTGVNALYNKPILARAGMAMAWTIGCHGITLEKGRLAPHSLPGAHWAMADSAFAVERRVKNRRLRQSRNNLEKGMTWQHHHVTEQSVLEECARHTRDPQLF
ncbi:hypothetical protein FACS1894206_00380 [Deltaproteobacteria bacterium]|nr:hypothetical protein FACS1894206_00380 [Deltaproteobacteria bacterium]